MAKPKILQQLNAEASSQILLKENPDVAMEAATKQYVDNSGGVFWAEYNVTTFDQLKEAYTQGKTIQVLYQNKIYLFTGYEEANKFTFTYVYTNHSRGAIMQSITCKSSGWNMWDINKLAHVGSSGNSGTIGYNTEFSISAFMNGASDITLGQARNITASLSAPTSTDGRVGDIWVVYNNE